MVSTRGTATPTKTPSKSATKKKSTRSLKEAAKTSSPAKAMNGTAKSTATPSSTTSSPSARPTTRSASHKAAVSSGVFPTEDKMVLAPKTEEYEFGGPIGCLGVTLSVPFFAYYLYYACNEQVDCNLIPGDWSLVFNNMAKGIVDSFFDGQAWLIYFGWYAWTVVAWAIIPGPWIDGTELRTKVKLQYKINAFRTMVVTLALVAAWIFVKGPESFTFLYDHWEGILTVSLINSFAQACYCYAVSFGQGRLLAKAANTGSFVHDWFLGRELNPRIGSFDIKCFNELRPGLILWTLLDLSCACAQYAKYGYVTDSMWLVLLFHFGYVADGLYNEPAILTTMDITTDGFGFMLSVGDLTWVPFTYSLQARYLAFAPNKLGLIGTAAILAFNGLGYYIFRVANSEKNDFRNGKDKKNLKYMTTSSGRKLITSGWWGMCRHPNYLGDLIMGLAWSLPTGFSTPIPYFYFFYFVVLLVHRSIRDNEACHEKYGKDWDAYCKKVPYVLLPGVY